MFWFSLAELRCSTPVTAQDKRSFNVLIKNAKDTKMRGKRIFLLSFRDPGSPRLASSPPRPPSYFSLKGLARLGELPWSQMPFFPVNRREGGLRKGFQHSALREIERNKGEEEKRENEAEAMPNRDCNQSLHRSWFGVLRSPFD